MIACMMAFFTYITYIEYRLIYVCYVCCFMASYTSSCIPHSPHKPRGVRGLCMLFMLFSNFLRNFTKMGHADVSDQADFRVFLQCASFVFLIQNRISAYYVHGTKVMLFTRYPRTVSVERHKDAAQHVLNLRNTLRSKLKAVLYHIASCHMVSQDAYSAPRSFNGNINATYHKF